MFSKKRNSVVCYCRKIVSCKKDTKQRMDNMKKFLEDNEMPHGLLMTSNNVFAYDPNNSRITEAFEYFWNIYLTDITHRDQPLWSYVLWKKNVKPHIEELKKNMQRCGCTGFRGHRYV